MHHLIHVILTCQVVYGWSSWNGFLSHQFYYDNFCGRFQFKYFNNVKQSEGEANTHAELTKLDGNLELHLGRIKIVFLYKFIAQLLVSFLFVENISLNFLNDVEICFNDFFYVLSLPKDIKSWSLLKQLCKINFFFFHRNLWNHWPAPSQHNMYKKPHRGQLQKGYAKRTLFCGTKQIRGWTFGCFFACVNILAHLHFWHCIPKILDKLYGYCAHVPSNLSGI